MGGAVRHHRIPRPRPLHARPGAHAMERHGRVRAAGRAHCAVLSRCRSGSFLAVRRLRAASGRDFWNCNRIAGAATAASRPHGVERNIRDRRARCARARTHLRPRKGLAHHRTGADGPWRGLGVGEAPAATVALACRHHGRGDSRPHRLRTAYRRHRSRHGANLQLASLWLRRSRAFVLGRGMAIAAARRRSAGSHRRCRRHFVHRAARDFPNPPLRHRWRYLPTGFRDHRSRA